MQAYNLRIETRLFVWCDEFLNNFASHCSLLRATSLLIRLAMVCLEILRKPIFKSEKSNLEAIFLWLTVQKVPGQMLQVFEGPKYCYTWYRTLISSIFWSLTARSAPSKLDLSWAEKRKSKNYYLMHGCPKFLFI